VIWLSLAQSFEARSKVGSKVKGSLKVRLKNETQAQSGHPRSNVFADSAQFR
jgi:hypothetical protein